ncbi:hypothetical protein E4T56_gene9121, partial [Termitomyces sp. T112]
MFDHAARHAIKVDPVALRIDGQVADRHVRASRGKDGEMPAPRDGYRLVAKPLHRGMALLERADFSLAHRRHGERPFARLRAPERAGAVTGQTPSLDTARPGDGNVMLADGPDQAVAPMAVAEILIELRPIVLGRIIGAAVLRGVRRLDHRPLAEMQPDAREQADREAEEAPGGQLHHPAATLMRGGDCGIDRAMGKAAPIGKSAQIRDHGKSSTTSDLAGRSTTNLPSRRLAPDTARHARRFDAGPGHFQMLRLVQIDVDEGNMHHAILAPRRRAMQRGRHPFIAPIPHLGQVERQSSRILKTAIHVKDMIGGRQHQLRVPRPDHRLEDVHHLGDVGHAHA